MHSRILIAACLVAALAPAALAQATVPASTEISSTGSATAYGPQPGDREFTLSGSGATNRKFNSSLGGATGSLGYYFTETSEGVLRQSIDYTNLKGTGSGGNAWDGTTAIAFDQHLIAQGPVRPFLGVDVGYVYGNTVQNTWEGGLEAGAKVYVLPRTFLFALVNYGWFFRHDKAIISRFDTGQWTWSAGIGFNF